MRDLVPFVQFKKHEKKTHGGVLHLVKLQAFRISGPIVEVKKSALINDYENIIACSEESEQSKVLANKRGLFQIHLGDLRVTPGKFGYFYSHLRTCAYQGVTIWKYNLGLCLKTKNFPSFFPELGKTERSPARATFENSKIFL